MLPDKLLTNTVAGLSLNFLFSLLMTKVIMHSSRVMMLRLKNTIYCSVSVSWCLVQYNLVRTPDGYTNVKTVLRWDSVEWECMWLSNSDMLSFHRTLSTKENDGQKLFIPVYVAKTENTIMKNSSYWYISIPWCSYDLAWFCWLHSKKRSIW